ncbi:MAG TPA: hypothetical protein VEI97_11360, partial [bacterium]|nr:hypothetical protein [bacterium]
LLLVLLLGAAVRWARGWATGAVLAAVLGLAAYLTRAFGVVLFPLAYAGVWWTRTGFKQPAGAFCRESAIACALFTIGAAGYIALVTARVGHFAWDGKSRHQFIRLAAPNLTLEERDPNYEGLVDASGLRYAPDTPWFEPLQGPAKITGAVRKYAMRHQRIWLRWLTDTVPPYGVPLFAGVTLLLVGAGAALVRPYVLSPGWRVWGALGVGIALVQPLTFIEIRYFVWLVPLALPLAAVALDRLAHWLKGRAPQGIDPKLLPAALALVVAGYNMLAIQPSLRKIADEDHRKNPYTAVAATIRDAPIPAPLAILDTSGIAAYYLGVPGYVIPDVPPERLAPFAEAQGASALVLDEQLARTKHNRVLLQFLYDVPADYPEYGLWLLGQGDPAPGKGWRVYTFIPPPGTLQGSP